MDTLVRIIMYSLVPHSVDSLMDLQVRFLFWMVNFLLTEIVESWFLKTGVKIWTSII